MPSSQASNSIPALFTSMIASTNTALLFLRYADASLAEDPLAVESTLLG